MKTMLVGCLLLPSRAQLLRDMAHEYSLHEWELLCKTTAFVEAAGKGRLIAECVAFLVLKDARERGWIL